MSSPSVIDRPKRHAVPLVVFLVVAVTCLVVPPVVLGEISARTYALTTAVIILAVGAAFPYAVFVALGTLPLLSTGIASFGAPQTGADAAHSLSTGSALRHVAAGVSYVLGAAVVGAVGMGGQIAVGSGSTAMPAVIQPSFLSLGGLLVAVIFVCLQLWRYDRPPGSLPRRTVLGTVALGVLLALSPVVAFWVFNGTL